MIVSCACEPEHNGDDSYSPPFDLCVACVCHTFWQPLSNVATFFPRPHYNSCHDLFSGDVLKFSENKCNQFLSAQVHDSPCHSAQVWMEHWLSGKTRTFVVYTCCFVFFCFFSWRQMRVFTTLIHRRVLNTFRATRATIGWCEVDVLYMSMYL